LASVDVLKMADDLEMKSLRGIRALAAQAKQRAAAAPH
jgi:hypothetical protein